MAQTVKRLAYNAGDLGSIPELGRSSGEGNGNPLQHSCLENPMDREAWWATVYEAEKSWTRLSDCFSQDKEFRIREIKFTIGVILLVP